MLLFLVIGINYICQSVNKHMFWIFKIVNPVVEGQHVVPYQALCLWRTHKASCLHFVIHLFPVFYISGGKKSHHRIDQQHVLDALMEKRGVRTRKNGGGRGRVQRTRLFGAWLDQPENLSSSRWESEGPQPIPAWVGLAPPGASSGARLGFQRRASPPLSLPHKAPFQSLLYSHPPGQRLSSEVCLGVSLPFPHRVQEGRAVQSPPVARTTKGHSQTREEQ